MIYRPREYNASIESPAFGKVAPLLRTATYSSPQTVVWCTGYRPDYSWIELPVTDSSGHAINERGVSAEAGLYFIGAEFQYALASATIQGLDQDARYLMEAMAKLPTTRPAATPARAAA